MEGYVFFNCVLIFFVFFPVFRVFPGFCIDRKGGRKEGKMDRKEGRKEGRKDGQEGRKERRKERSKAIYP